MSDRVLLLVALISAAVFAAAESYFWSGLMVMVTVLTGLRIWLRAKRGS